MKIKGHVRLLRPLDGGLFPHPAFDFLLAHEGRGDQNTTSIGFIKSVSRPSLLLHAYELSIFLRVQRLALYEEPRQSDGVVTREVAELERVPTYLFPDLKLAFFEDPELNTRELSPKDAIRDAGEVLLKILERVGRPCTLDLPTGQRPKSFFIDLIRSIARGGQNLRLSEIVVSEIEGKSLADPREFPLYNPNPEAEDTARRILSPAIRDFSKVTIQASNNGDLSHNPVARAVAGAGTPEEMVVTGPPRPGKKRPMQRYYKRRISDRLEAKTSGSETRLEAINNALLEGDYKQESLSSDGDA